MNTILNKEQIQSLGKDYRTQLINSISGYKSANLIGTVNPAGLSNLAIFSSVVHLGANPALMGMISRPFAENVRRHTYDNLCETGYFTINHAGIDWVEKAHQTSARYDDQTSEFEAVGLSEEWIGDFPAPFVAESRVKIGLKYLQTIDIELNNTKMIIGEIILIQAPTDCIDEQGHLDLIKAQTAAVSGLDTYHSGNFLATFPYAKPKKAQL